MFAIVGILVVFGAVIGGYLMEKGHIQVLLQPAELLIIAGAAIGTLLVANPMHILKAIAGGILGTLKSSPFGKERYLSTLRMMYQFLNKVRKEGLLSVESDVEKPAESAIFKNYPEFIHDHHACEFVCDTLRMAITGGVEPLDMDQMMELDMEVHHHGATVPVTSLSTMADSLPGLGIVAAVLGVVITMEAIGASPETVGQKVAAALVGTFLGILLCYGVVGPVASRLETLSESQAQFLQVLRIAVIAFARGASPLLAVEYARRSIPIEMRPSSVAMEATIRRDARIPPLPKPPEPSGDYQGELQTEPAQPAQPA